MTGSVRGIVSHSLKTEEAISKHGKSNDIDVA